MAELITQYMYDNTFISGHVALLVIFEDNHKL